MRADQFHTTAATIRALVSAAAATRPATGHGAVLLCILQRILFGAVVPLLVAASVWIGEHAGSSGGTVALLQVVGSMTCLLRDSLVFDPSVVRHPSNLTCALQCMLPLSMLPTPMKVLVVAAVAIVIVAHVQCGGAHCTYACKGRLQKSLSVSPMHM